MERVDPQKAARVWQRVHTENPSPEQGLLSLIAQEWADASTYLQLSRRLQGKSATVLRTLYEQEQTHLACLKGIYTLITGTHPKVASVPLPQEDIEQTLRRCYGRAMRCLAAYEARSTDPEYGPVFARLADREREHCRLLLELLGKLTEKAD